MGEANKKDEFTFKAGELTAAFFLDYSQKEIQDTQKLREDDDHFINRKTLRVLVTEHPFFAKFFHWLRYDTAYVRDKTQPRDDSGKKIPREKKGNAIPVELLSFFKLYMMEVRSKKEKSTAVRNEKIPEGMGESFYQRLLEYARAEEQKSDSCDSEIYWTRCLYENKCFQKVAVRDLWDEEYLLRTKGLYEKVKLLPPEKQLKTFRDVVQFLDTEITKAANDAAGVQTQDTGLEMFLDEFPKQVISRCRKRTVSTGQKRLVNYTVENIPLAFEAEDNGSSDNVAAYTVIPSLEEAKNRICGNMDGSLKLKKVARAAYLRRLNQEAQKSEFQEDYEKSLAYVNACTVEISPEELREKIASRAAAYFGSAFRGEIATPGYYIPDPNNTWQQSEMDRLIEDHVAKSYSSYYCQNKYYLEFINSSRSYRDDFAAQIANLARFSWDDPNVLENKQVFLFCRQMYMNFLGAVMPTALRSKFRIGILVTVEQQQLLAEHIVELGMQTFRKLEIDTMPWMNVTAIKLAIGHYNCVVYPMDENKLPGFSQSDVSLQKALITISVGEAFDSCCSETERSILALTAAIKEMKQKQP